jgi:SNF2 family DNA or RNA helicase
MITLTEEYTKRKQAAAVPGAYFEGGRWLLPRPTPRSSVVALKLFPHLAVAPPVVGARRPPLFRDIKPVDYPANLNLRVNAPRVEAEMNRRGWSLSKPKVTPTNSDELYQVRDLGYAAAALRQYGGFYLGWDRGLGKTLGTAALFDDLDVRAGLVVAPNTAKQNTWAAELQWACPWLAVLVMPNDAKQREKCLENVKTLHQHGTSFVLVTHYESMAIIAGKKTHVTRRGADEPTKLKTARIQDGWAKLGIVWDLIAADEGHRLANPTAQRAKAAYKIPAKARLVLSGSVFQNEWEELFGPLKFILPESYIHPKLHWGNRFLDFVDNGYTSVCIGVREGREEALREELGRFMVIRQKQNLAIMRRVEVELSPEQRRVYDELGRRLLADLPNGKRIKSETGIALLGKLRQVSAGLDAFDPDHITDSAKLDAAEQLIKEGLPEGDDFVVFVWHKAVGRALAKRLEEQGVESWVIDGDVSQKQRDDMIARFQKGERRVMIGSIATMGESVNLQRANRVIRVELSFNPALNQQAVDRCDRQGQERKVYCDDIVALNTVDTAVVEPTLGNKEALRAVVFGS